MTPDEGRWVAVVAGVGVVAVVIRRKKKQEAKTRINNFISGRSKNESGYKEALSLLGLTEETDAIVIVVSEERGAIATAEDGRFANLDMDEMALRRFLNERLFISSGD